MAGKQDLMGYKNFWLIWLSCAGKGQGESLFQVQTRWGIRTNYLYHNETGLGKPLYARMIRDGYLEKSGPRIKSLYSWIPGYVKSMAGEAGGGVWYPGVLFDTKWPRVQGFIEGNAQNLFSDKALKVLYRNDRDLLGLSGGFIFHDIFFYVLFSNLILFTHKYKADIVMRIISTAISILGDRDLLGYMRLLHEGLFKEVPAIITSEAELDKLMCPYKW
jgi:hypothetical protein